MRRGQNGGQRMGFAGQDLQELRAPISQLAATATAGPNFLIYDSISSFLSRRDRSTLSSSSFFRRAGGDDFGMSRRIRLCSKQPDLSPRSFVFASNSLLPKGPPCLA
jgi:hypothetical protein